MEHADIQQAHLSCWRRNPAIGGRENDIAAQIFGNRVAGKVLRRTIQHTFLQNANVDAISSMWLSAKAGPGDLPAPAVAHASQKSVVSTLQKDSGSPATRPCNSPETRWPVIFGVGIPDHKTCIAGNMHCKNANPGI